MIKASLRLFALLLTIMVCGCSAPTEAWHYPPPPNWKLQVNRVDDFRLGESLGDVGETLRRNYGVYHIVPTVTGREGTMDTVSATREEKLDSTLIPDTRKHLYCLRFEHGVLYWIEKDSSAYKPQERHDGLAADQARLAAYGMQWKSNDTGDVRGEVVEDGGGGQRSLRVMYDRSRKADIYFRTEWLLDTYYQNWAMYELRDRAMPPPLTPW